MTECHVCNKDAAHSWVCDACSKSGCYDCTFKCSVCSGVFCIKCSEKINCAHCGEFLCGADNVFCFTCRRDLCEKCAGNLKMHLCKASGA